MAYHRNPIVAEPYEEPQAPESQTDRSPESLKAFYEDVERRETMERKLSKGKSNPGSSIWSRTLKRSPTAPSAQSSSPLELTRNPSSGEKGARGEQQQQMSRGEQYPRLKSSASATAVPLPTFKVKYHLHNPLGPRWYKNHHLIPPSQMRPSLRPPTFFSTSFPPISTSSMPERSEDAAGTSGTPSHSPLPTPDSSQTRVGDSGKPRSRKTSQTTPDNVDLLDVTDPWGTNWHHQSPYDVFGQTTSFSLDPQDLPNRTRRASMTAAQGRHTSVMPSPLSQSTSAVHLQAPQPEIELPRKLSKRKPPTIGSIFAPHSTEGHHRKAASAPVTPIEHITLVQPSDITSLPKRMSVAPPLTIPPQTSKKEKRSSVLNRLAKKFSLLRKPTDNELCLNDGPSGWQYSGSINGLSELQKPSERSNVDPVKRIPPPAFEQSAQPMFNEPPHVPERSSLASLDTPFSIGRLTVANPDLPSLEVETPDLGEAPLPPEKPKDLQGRNHTRKAVEPSLLQSNTLSSRTQSRQDKPLPPPQPTTPRPSLVDLSDIQTLQANDFNPSLEYTIGEPLMTENTKASLEDSKEVASQAPPTSVNPNLVVDTTPAELSRQQPQPLQSQVMPENPKKSDSQPISLPVHNQTVTNDRSPTRSASIKTEMQEGKFKRAPSSRRASPSDANVVNKNSAPERATSAATSLPNERPFNPPATNAPKVPSNSRLDSTPVPIHVPFPVTQPIPAFPSRETRDYAAPSYEDSPLSASSVIANPPTPYNRLSIPLSEELTAPPSLPPNSPPEAKRLSHEPSPVNSSPSRQTETFKLVRSSSGNVYASGETISAAGQQWEVVESVEAKEKRRKSSKLKEETGNRRESKAESRSKADVEHGDYRHSHSHRSSKVSYYPREEPSKSKTISKTSSQRPEERSHREERVRPEEHSLPAERPRHEERSYREQRPHREQRSHEERPYREQRPHREQRSHEELPYREQRPHREQRSHEERPYREQRPHREQRSHREERHHHEARSHREERSHREVYREERSYRDERPQREGEGHSHNSENKGYKRDEYRHDPKSTRSAEIHSTSNQTSGPRPVLVQGHSDPPAIRLERNVSITARPTSELPSAAEMNAMRAKESWEMERLWRARSMYGLEPNAPTTNFIPGPGSTSSRSDDTPPPPAIYGSSHTAFVVQTPFHGPSAQIYHSMPTAPPPIIYSSPASIPSIPDSLSSYDPYDPYRSYPTSTPTNFKAPSSLSRPPLNNPLPEPPRESPYEPAPLPSTRQGNRHSSDYWTKSTGITTAR